MANSHVPNRRIPNRAEERHDRSRGAAPELPFGDAAVAPQPPAIRRVSLVKLAGELARAAAEVGKFIVEGEVSRPTTSAANRTYFVIKDRGVQMSVVVPSARQAFCRVRSGERVAVTGHLEFQTDRGQLQLVASEVVPVGDGAIAAMIAETRERLTREGLMSRPRKPLPLLPTLVGILCGTEAAVRADIEAVVAARFPDLPVRFFEVVVAGPGAVESISAGLHVLQQDLHVEVIVVARGGGDANAMLPFSDETLCRAIANCRVPVVSAVGHESDRPLSDEIADHRAGTPSIAAAMVIPDRALLQARCDRAFSLVGERAVAKVASGSQRLQACSWDAAVGHRLERCMNRLDRVDVVRTLVACVDRANVRLQSVAWTRAIDPTMTRAAQRLDMANARIESLSPARVLERGYAVVRTGAGVVVRDASSVRIGETVDIVVAKGRLAATVEGATLWPPSPDPLRNTVSEEAP